MMMVRPSLRTAGLIAAGWLAVFVAVTLFRPLMPVDETRYLTVAWEMLVRDNWLLPSLNYEPYSHKPPLLFWLIRAGWGVFGDGVMGPRLVLSAFILFLFFLTGRLARTLVPQDAVLPGRSVLLLAALPVFLIYASLIMFDSLLAVFVMLGLLCIWRASRTGGFKPWALLGLAIGVGILAKGPVALVYILPTALLAPVWLNAFPIRRRRWYAYTGLAVLIGAAIALSWAVPAALQGGPAYAEKIFITQSAGRMVKAFDHRQPFWFYVPVVLGFLAPLLVWPDLWRAVRDQGRALIRDVDLRRPVRFLLCAIVPVFIFFSAISSKQIHYMLPIMPACCILAAILLSRGVRGLSALLPVLLSGVPSIVFLWFYLMGGGGDGVAHALIGFLPWLAGTHLAFVAALAFLCVRRPAFVFESVAVAAFALVVVLHVQLGQGFLPRYDLSPLRAPFEDYRAGPVAITPKYDGEYGYAMRLPGHADVIEAHLIGAWLAAHPGGVVIVRDDAEADLSRPFSLVFSQPFRFDRRIALVRGR